LPFSQRTNSDFLALDCLFETQTFRIELAQKTPECRGKQPRGEKL